MERWRGGKGWKECLRELTHRTISIRKTRCQLRLDQEYGEAERGESERWKGGEMKRWKGGKVKRWKGGWVERMPKGVKR